LLVVREMHYTCCSNPANAAVLKNVKQTFQPVETDAVVYKQNPES